MYLRVCDTLNCSLIDDWILTFLMMRDGSPPIRPSEVDFSTNDQKKRLLEAPEKGINRQICAITYKSYSYMCCRSHCKTRHHHDNIFGI